MPDFQHRSPPTLTAADVDRIAERLRGGGLIDLADAKALLEQVHSLETLLGDYRAAASEEAARRRGAIDDRRELIAELERHDPASAKRWRDRLA